MAGVSRQAVSLWFLKGRDGSLPVRSDHLVKLCRKLGIGLDDLVTPLPDAEKLETSLLWDRLYPNVPALIAAAADGEHRALARLVQVHGVLVSTKLFGRKVIEDFHRYKRYIHPARREESERVWKTIDSLRRN
jgi:hypothetical protein